MKPLLRSTMAACVLAASGGLVGCEGACPDPPEGERIVRYEGGRVDLTSTFYETSPISGPYVAFPARKALEIVHGLPGVPVEIDPYLSFEKTPFPSGFASAAGDLAVVTCANDHIFRIQNTTCEDHLYVRVTAEFREFTEPQMPLCE